MPGDPSSGWEYEGEEEKEEGRGGEGGGGGIYQAM